jgi:hypothetical protein
MKDPIKKVSINIAFLVISLLAAFSMSSLALAQGGARLYLQQVEAANGILTVDVVAENVTDLYGLEVHLKYDPAVLAAQDAKADQDGIQIEAGNFLPVNQGFVVANQTKEAEGEITFAMTLLNPAPAVSGGGPVARVSFKVLQDVPATINIEKATLVSVNLQSIPVETVPLTVGDKSAVEAGSPANSSAAPAVVVEKDSFPWWIVAALVLLLGIVAIGAFVVMGGFVQSRPKLAVERQRATEQSSRRSRGHPSAFKEQAFQKPPQPRQ